MSHRLRLLSAVVTFALLAPAAATGAERPFGLSADCPLSHRAHDDPIVHPGHPGASHSHDFFGNRSTDARSTPGKLRRRGTTCDPKADRSAYWAPTLRHRGRTVAAARALFYYVVTARERSSVRAFPDGLRIIAGNEQTRQTAVSPRYAWTCTRTTVLHAARIPRCARGSRLVLRLRFPDCWDGRRSDSPDHRSHMAYSPDGRCPESHPVAVPQLRFEIRYRTRGGRRTRLSSGPVWTTHGDFVNAWDQEEFRRLLDACVLDESCVEDPAAYDGDNASPRLHLAQAR
jgi:hypothetical protein